MTISLNDLRFLPVDVPYAKCDSQKIKQFMDSESVRVNYPWTEKINQPWNHVIVRDPSFNEIKGIIPGSNWRSDFYYEFPEVVNTVENLPYQKISYVYLFEQCIEVKPHFDVVGKNFNEALEPASYRINLLMEDEQAFYICDSEAGDTYSHPRFPPDSNTWVFSNKKFMHGSLIPESGKRKILLVIGKGILNSEKHLKLLENSYLKYKNFIL
jgi:hypothetical protein